MVQLGAFVSDDKKPVEVEVVVQEAAKNPTTQKPTVPATSSCKPQALTCRRFLHDVLMILLWVFAIAFTAFVIFMLYGVFFMVWTAIVDHAHHKPGQNATSDGVDSSGRDVASLNITIQFKFLENVTQYPPTETTSAPTTTAATAMPALDRKPAEANADSAEMLPELLINDLAPLSQDQNPFLAMNALMRSLFGLSVASEQRAKQFIQGQGPALMAL